jgi:hypothetical protein
VIVTLSPARRAALCDGGAATGCGTTGPAAAGGKRAGAADEWRARGTPRRAIRPVEYRGCKPKPQKIPSRHIEPGHDRMLAAVCWRPRKPSLFQPIIGKIGDRPMGNQVGSTHWTTLCHPSKSGKFRCARQTPVLPSWQHPAARVSAARDQPAACIRPGVTDAAVKCKVTSSLGKSECRSWSRSWHFDRLCRHRLSQRGHPARLAPQKGRLRSNAAL